MPDQLDQHTSPPPNESMLCAKCVDNRRFSGWIRRHGVKGKCDFDPTHGSSRKVVSVEKFAEEVDRYFRYTYQRGEEYLYATADSDNPSYDHYGEPYPDILANELNCNEALLKAVIDNLPDCSDRDIAQGAEPFYDDLENYERIEDAEARHGVANEEYWYEFRYSLQWGDFCRTVQYERRFFKIKSLLDSLFGKPEEYGEGDIKPIYTLQPGLKIYRARLLDVEFTERLLEKSADVELGAPPREKTRPGRMNVEFIPAFYAAFSKETAVAEIRPSIGDRVAVGEFVLRESLMVFDFTVFEREHGEGKKDLYSHTRYDFITQMQREISKPISPFEKTREYIPTQIVAEYLREHFACGGVIYASSMQRDNELDNRNVVFLNRGDDFRGLLKLARYDLKEIRDVVYKMDDAIIF